MAKKVHKDQNFIKWLWKKYSQCGNLSGVYFWYLNINEPFKFPVLVNKFNELFKVTFLVHWRNVNFFMWEFWYISKLKKINKISGIFYVTILVYIPKVDRRTYTPKVFTE